ncbi:D-Ala-D-Ala carboxypeptidase family metallohydrolase [Wukongibacter baidiensis]|uniref:D-Ala-D-Ala carboxypeptidase family metallohydrolase n=1 Tax=Wukongibacter baidiensis TaxID=1723361 RepID=UPI003D7FFDB3
MLNVKVYDGQITKNFNLIEFKCKADGELLLNAEVIDHIQRLQRFREWYKRVMSVISGYRTEEYNTKIGGSKNSMHIKGIASDIALPSEFYSFTKARQEEFLNNVKNKWIQLCDEDGLGGGVGFYDTFFHIDSREKGNYSNGSYAFWDNRSKK